MEMMNKSWQVLLAMLLTLAFTSCGNDDEIGSESMISGADSKTWVAEEITTAAGDKQEITDMEAAQTMQFYADGRFALGGSGTLQTGTWSYDAAAKRLSLQFENQEVTENFEVMKLDEDEMNLKAADGTVLEMELKE